MHDIKHKTLTPGETRHGYRFDAFQIRIFRMWTTSSLSGPECEPADSRGQDLYSTRTLAAEALLKHLKSVCARRIQTAERLLANEKAKENAL